MPTTLRFYRRNLPHWLVADRPYFVTLRLAGTLPRNVVEELAAERETLLADAPDEAAWTALRRKQFVKIERILDTCDPSRNWLGAEPVAKLVLGNLQWLETQRGWRLYAACIMPNHVHIVMRNATGRSGELLGDIGQFKNFTARLCNEALKRKGPFWAREDFDHWCRNEDKVRGAVRYTLNNPVKAGLVKCWREWPWSRVEADYEPVAAGS